MNIELPEETQTRWTTEAEGTEAAQREADRAATFCVGPAGYCDCEGH
jgi:hypothetical protein